ncbi:MAG: heavy metal translocating P-type ATPase [Bacteroidia bacterium]
MFIPWHVLHHPWFQLIASLPVYAVGFFFFGRSAFHSVKNGVPNMDVLIFIGSLSAFIYSLAGVFLLKGTSPIDHYLFFETGTTIITLVLLGNLIEKNSVKRTTKEINELQKLRDIKARKLHFENGKEHIHEISYDEIKIGDILLVNSGDPVPIDGIIKSGNGLVNEAMITGESIPVSKDPNDSVIGGTVLLEGNFRIQSTANSKTSVLAGIIDMVKTAQSDKPPVQRLADKISFIFVPTVLILSLVAFLVNAFVLDISFRDSLMRAIAVLVISCPCAMGLATPTAVMVGIGKAARNGILIKQASVLESFSKTNSIVFDKTGTLTTGNFLVKFVHRDTNSSEEEIRNILYNLEMHSSHPIAKSVVKNKSWFISKINFTKVEEQKGKGITANDESGNRYELASTQVSGNVQLLSGDIFLMVNEKLLATFSLTDEVKEGVNESVDYFHRSHIETVLLSGDSQAKCEETGRQTGIKKIIGGQLPAQKLQMIDALSASGKITMVGDGINDSPALSKADVAVSFSDASEIARQSSQIVIIKKDFEALKRAHIISSQTYRTIKQNLFWAFFYNIIAIPLAAAGFLSPMLAALSMAFSDVVVVGNSIRLRFLKVK